MRIKTFFAKKNSAQAMVEFALALPVLLLLLYGVLEAGRLLFLYSTVVTGSRQAVRYGAATGVNDDGTPRYNDCAGIRASANSVAFLSGPDRFDDVKLYTDTGAENNDETEYCPDPAADLIGNITTAELEGNSTRLVVQVTDHFSPLLPNFLPFLERDIVAKSARTILYSVPIVMDQDETGFYQERTTTTITADTPDASGPGATVTLTILVVSDADNDTVTTPTGKILITGVDDASGCGGVLGIDLVASGSDRATVTCTVTFSTSGNKVISATYSGDDTHLPGSDVENHTVQVSTTVTTITFIAPNPAVKNQNVSFTVTVTGGSTTPTGTVQVSGGGNNNCTVALVNGTGTCTIVGGFNSAGTKSITATYSGDSGHLTSTSPTVSLQVLNGTATPSSTPVPTLSPTSTIQPTTTLSPTATLSPTVTLSPTLTPTVLASCNSVNVTHGPLTIAGTISMSITNNTGVPLLVQDVFVDWYHEKGHKTGSDKTLRLQSATLGGVTFFTGNLYAPSTTITPTGLYVPTGSSSVIFTFHQSADFSARDGNEKIVISLATNGCSSVTIDSSH